MYYTPNMVKLIGHFKKSALHFLVRSGWDIEYPLIPNTDIATYIHIIKPRSNFHHKYCGGLDRLLPECNTNE